MNYSFDLLERMRLQNELASVWAEMSKRYDTIQDKELKSKIKKKVKVLMEVDSYLCYLEQTLHTEKKQRQRAEYDLLKFKLEFKQLSDELNSLKKNIHEQI